VLNSSNEYSNPRIDYPEVESNAVEGRVYLDIPKSIWVASLFLFGIIGSALTITLSSVLLFFFFTGLTLCLGHSLGMHRRFIHRSYRCPIWNAEDT